MSDGFTLPENIPIKPCANCEGTGRPTQDSDGYDRCHVCKGSGIDFADGLDQAIQRLNDIDTNK